MVDVRRLGTALALLSFTAGAALGEPPPASPPPAAAVTPAPATTVVVQTPIPLAHDACLDHAVKELGMSAKRAEGAARHWDIAAKFLHATVAKDVGAALTVDLEKGDKSTLIKVRTSWPGAPKDKAVQLEMEERLRAMATKMSQQCGVTKPELACTVTPAGGAAAPCTPIAPTP
ncbi:MAG: hypothetical protein HYS27_27175 [Deltaproteobacteria bacterium]|nr:hypothetical protein [Deltaproteobacteria bacterium]